MGIGLTELLFILVIGLFFLPAVAVGLVLWVVFKGRNRDRIGEIESRLERVERQLDRESESSSSKQRD
jgi:hypothetical protein